MIRTAFVADADALASIEQVCFGVDAWSRAMVLDELAAEHRVVLVLESEGSATGYVSVSVAGDTADLHRVALVPPSRRQGGGRALVESGIRRAVEQGAMTMLLEVVETNEPAVQLYQALGFATISRREGYPRAGVTSLVMQRDLTA